MTWLLASLVALLVGTNITITVWWRGAVKSKDAVRDVADKWRESAVSAVNDLRIERANVQVLTDELESVKKLLAVTERQRNDAYGAARDHLVQRLQTAKIADSAKFVADLLATPIAGGVLPKRPDPNDPRDALIDPATED